MADITPGPNPNHFDGVTRVRGKRRGIMLRGGYAGIIKIVLEDGNGVPLDLTSGAFLAAGDTIVGRLQEHNTPDAVDVAGAPLAPLTNGEVRFILPESYTSRAGIYLLEISVRRDALEDGLPESFRNEFIDDVYVLVERGAKTDCVGIPTIAEMRLALRDYAADNEPIWNIDFDVSEIVSAATMAIDEWNEADPDDGPKYNTRNFPYRRNWMTGMVAYLMEIAAQHYARTSLAHQGSGLLVDDKNKAPLYLQMAAKARQDWLTFVNRRKRQLTLIDGYGL